MKPFARADRISNRIQTTLSELLHKKVNDPRLEMATITGVKMTQDLREAYVYFTTSSGEKSQKDAEKGFNRAMGFLRSALAKKLGLRYMPKLTFIHDGSFDYGARIDAVLKNLDAGGPGTTIKLADPELEDSAEEQELKDLGDGQESKDAGEDQER